MLRPNTLKALEFICDTMMATGVSPTEREIYEHVGMRSPNSGYRLIKELEDRGYIRRLPGCKRAIEVLRTPDGTPASVTRDLVGALPNRERLLDLIYAADARVDRSEMSALVRVALACQGWGYQTKGLRHA